MASNVVTMASLLEALISNHLVSRRIYVVEPTWVACEKVMSCLRMVRWFALIDVLFPHLLIGAALNQ